MGTLSITAQDGSVEVLGDLEMPVSLPLGLDPYTSPRPYPIACEVCGAWAGDLILPRSMSENDMASAALEVTNRLCPRHWQGRKWGRK